MAVAGRPAVGSSVVVGTVNVILVLMKTFDLNIGATIVRTKKKIGKACPTNV